MPSSSPCRWRPPARANRHLAQLRQTVEETGALPGWVWVVTAAGFAAFLLVCWRSGSRAARLLAAAALWVGLLSFSGTHDQKLLAHMTHALRYYYAPQFFFLLALLAALAPGTSLPPVLKALGALWLAAALLMGLVNFACGPLDWPIIFSGPPWASPGRAMAQGPLQAARRLAGGLAVQPATQTLTRAANQAAFIVARSNLPAAGSAPPPAHAAGAAGFMREAGCAVCGALAQGVIQ